MSQLVLSQSQEDVYQELLAGSNIVMYGNGNDGKSTVRWKFLRENGGQVSICPNSLRHVIDDISSILNMDHTEVYQITPGDTSGSNIQYIIEHNGNISASNKTALESLGYKVFRVRYPR